MDDAIYNKDIDLHKTNFYKLFNIYCKKCNCSDIILYGGHGGYISINCSVCHTGVFLDMDDLHEL